MGKNTLFGIILVCLAALLNGCVGVVDSRIPFYQHQQDILDAQKISDQEQGEKAKEQPPITAEEIPGNGAIIRTPVGTMETHFEGYDGEDGAYISLGLGSENVHKRAGKRDAKRSLRRDKQEKEEMYVRERVRLDAFFEHNNPYDFSAMYRSLYEDLFEIIAGRASEMEYDRYRNDQYEAGRNSVLGIESREDEKLYGGRQQVYEGGNRDVDYAIKRAWLDAKFDVKPNAPTGVLTKEGLIAYYNTFKKAIKYFKAHKEQGFNRHYHSRY